MPETIIPPLPAVPSSADAPTRKWMGAVKEMLEVWAARRGDLLDQVVTYRDLLAVDMVNVSSRYPRLDSSGMTVGAVTTDVTIPPVVTGIVATGGYRNIFIEWDATTYNNRAYSEVLRSSVDVVGDAVVIGQTTGTIYVDAVGNSATYFYWVRSVSRSGIAGQMQTNGVSATSAVDVEYMLDVLTGEITESQLYVDLNSRIDLIDGPSIDPGTVNFRVLDLENRERRERVAQVDSNAEAALRAVLAVHDARLDAANTVAIAERALRQDIVDGVSAEASERLTLAAKVDTDIGTTVALIVDEATARADGDTAEATARELLRTTLESADADVIALVSTEAAARVSGDEAEAYQRTLLQASLEADDDVLTARIFTEETTRATADTALAQQITLLSAGAGEQFDWQTIWYFDSGIESWGGNGTPTASNGFLRPADQASSAYVTSPTGMATDAAKYGQMRLRVRKTGTVTFAGWLWWREAADSTWDTGRRIALVEPTWDANDIGLITVTPEWTGTIDRIRIDLSDAQTVTDYMALDWVAVGRPSPGASSAQLLTEQTARIAGDTAIAEDVTELHAQVNHVTTGLPAAHAAVVTEASARASADTALTTSFNTLNAQVNHATTGLPAAFAAVEDEATARASAIDAEAATRELLAARVTDAESDIVTNAASIVTEQTARADEDTALANSITALQAVVTDAETGIVQTQADLQSEQTVRATADDANATDVRRLRAKTEDADETALRNLLIGEGARGQFIGAIAVAQQELTSDIVAGLSAEAAARLDLQAAVNDNAAYVVDNIYTKTDTDSAIAGQITEFKTNTLEADYTNTAELVLNYYTKTDADGAIASSATTLRAYADTAADTAADAASNAQSTADGKITTYTNAGIPTATVPTTTAALGDLCFDTNDGNKLYRWGGLSWAPVRDESIADVDARITTVETTKIGYCTLAGAASDHTTSTTCESAGGTWHVGLPLATAVKQVSVSDGVQTASLETVMQAHKTTLGNLESEYIVKIDNAGIMSGFGLYSGLAGSKFIANVDQFAVMTPISGVTARANSTVYAAGVTVKVGSVTARLLVCKSAGTSGGSAPTLTDSTTIGSLIEDGTVIWQVASSVPFVVQTTGATVNGVTVPAGIYMDAAYIINATITGAQIGAEAVDNSHIANLSVEKLTSGSIEVGSYIESTNFLSGSQGWRIHGDGTAELSEAIVRGTVYATDGEFSGSLNAADGTLGTLTMGAGGYIQSSNYSSGTTGWKLSETAAELNGVALNAATGTFAGALSAATGTFAGAMNAGSININNKFTVDSSGNVEIKSATTGARMEIENDVIRVYDSTGALRVKIGNLA